MRQDLIHFSGAADPVGVDPGPDPTCKKNSAPRPSKNNPEPTVEK